MLTVVGARLVVRCCKAWRDLILKYVGKPWLTRSFLSLLTYIDSNQITILSDSSFWAYDENYRRYDYKMPCGNIKHYDGIQRVLERHGVSIDALTNSRVIFLHMPSTLHKDLDNIQDTEYEEWKYSMKEAARVQYAWAERNSIELELWLLIDTNNYDAVWVPKESERCKGKDDLRRVIGEKHEFEEAYIQIIIPRSKPSDWFWGHWTPSSLVEGCEEVLRNLGLAYS